MTLKVQWNLRTKSACPLLGGSTITRHLRTCFADGLRLATPPGHVQGVVTSLTAQRGVCPVLKQARETLRVPPTGRVMQTTETQP